MHRPFLSDRWLLVVRPTRTGRVEGGRARRRVGLGFRRARHVQALQTGQSQRRIEVDEDDRLKIRAQALLVHRVDDGPFIRHGLHLAGSLGWAEKLRQLGRRVVRRP